MNGTRTGEPRKPRHGAGRRYETPHMSAGEVRAAVAEIQAGDAAITRERSAQLAWRPAWAIRSRRGAFSVLMRWIYRVES